jgi:Tfp pilus assembly pilus retraction ATPase PilT
MEAALTMLIREYDITDIHLLDMEMPDGSYAFTMDATVFYGRPVSQPTHVVPLRLSDVGGDAAWSQVAEALHAAIARKRDRQGMAGVRDFSVQCHQTRFRVRLCDTASEGIWYNCRKNTDKAPVLDRLPSPLPSYIGEALMRKEWTMGGLILVSGGPGCGKSTTASAVVVSRLMQFGGFAYTIEDPVEFNLSGTHGKGRCIQTEVHRLKGEADWIESIRAALRAQPTGTPLILFVGELRDPATAAMMIRAASNGFLVVATTFAFDVMSAIDTLFQMLGPQYAGSLAATLRCVLFQRIIDGRFLCESMESLTPSSPLANAIRARNLQMVSDLVAQNRALLRTPGAMSSTPLKAG